MAEPYIKPRKKLPDETERDRIIRELEEYIEFEYNTKRFSDVSFHEKVLDFIMKEC